MERQLGSPAAPVRLIIVQPWFTAVGHPAQSLLNTARVLGVRDDILYVVSSDPAREELRPMLQELAAYGRVHQYAAPRASFSLSTLLALTALVKILRGSSHSLNIFFLDAHLLVLAMFHPVFKRLARNVRSISMLGLSAPESVTTRRWKAALVRRWIKSESTRMYLRTEELAAAWREALGVQGGQCIDTLPSLEIPEAESLGTKTSIEGPTRFGVVGQIRVGKGLEWLVPLFQQNSDMGDLRIHGAFFNDRQRYLLPALVGFRGFRERFIPDKELIACVASFDYLLTLYDLWDHRLEAATFYLAARAGRPVIAYDLGWCGRMIREFGCGIAIPMSPKPDPDFFRMVPTRGSAAYAEMVKGVGRFRDAHSGDVCRAEFLAKLIPGSRG